MRLARVILRVTDMRRALDFWSGMVGLDVLFESPAFSFLEAGGCQVVLNQVDAPESPGQTELVLEVDDVEAAHREMTGRGVPFEVGLRPVTSDGDRDLLAAHFRDPDGNLASLTGWVGRSDQR